MFDSLVAWTQTTLMPLGVWGVGLLAFMESAFFPIPPEALLLPLIILGPANAFLYALVATVSSTFGSLFGWQIGKRGGKPLLKKFASTTNIKRATKLFENHGAWSLIISGLTPIPYKVFTITAGALDYNDLPRFIVACTIGRGARFFLEALLIIWIGPQLIPFIENSLGWLLLVIIAGVLILWFAAQKFLKSKKFF